VPLVDAGVFDREVKCTYRGERYCVRDNGALLRRPRPGKRKRRLDGKWTFGRPCAHKGYMVVSNHTVHRVVATAFSGSQPSKNHVVDHIDTNRRNNRPENLRWVTRLENILLNPITAKRVEYHYGSIENFLANPGKRTNRPLRSDFEWMRTVTQAEAAYSRKRLLAWAEVARPGTGGQPGEWIYGSSQPTERKEQESLVESKTPGAVQRNWSLPAEFPLSPQCGETESLEAYLKRLPDGAVFAVSRFGQTTVVKSALSSGRTELFVFGEFQEGAVKPWSLACVTHEGGRFVRESRGTFFALEGAEKQFALMQGLPWEGGDSIDDYC
jgi:hypothetical protein